MPPSIYEIHIYTLHALKKIFSYIPKKSLRGIRKNVLSMAFNKNNIPSTIQITPHLLGGLLKGHGGFLSELLGDFMIVDRLV